MASVQSLKITQLRNLSHVAIEPSPGINIFYGANGSGKTSLLEAVSLIGLGRSFRIHKNRPLIQLEASELVVFAEVSDGNQKVPIGLQKNRKGQTQIKLQGDPIQSAVSLAQQLPLQIIDASAFQLIEGAPGQRRRFLDWLVFHVKPDFIHYWKRLQRALKQRNQLLRSDKISGSELEPWDKELGDIAKEIHQMRQDVFESYRAELNKNDLLKSFTERAGIKSVEISYLPGWDVEQDFKVLLDESRAQDISAGYTRVGPQRADISLTVLGKPAAEILSRGQEKALICALHIAQAKLYQAKTGQSCVFLIDDLLAELDRNNANCLAKWLCELNTQVWVTGIEKELLNSVWLDMAEPPRVFHVEQGNVSLIKE